MDPISMIDLGGSLFEICGLGCELASQAQEIYTSKDGLRNQNAELRDRTTCLQELVRPLAAGEVPHTSGEEALRRIAMECCFQLEKLLEILKGLQIPENARNQTLIRNWKIERMIAQCTPPWKNTMQANTCIFKKDKENAAKEHNQLLKCLAPELKDGKTSVYYTDGSKDGNKNAAGVSGL
ncbi:hypothetical protein M501DRAFT_1015977 [Patellaria atrata CBS 101060]|uniref:NACHT-NTPase and P-loop NTPases N-terminal domain-containing protein n=1 Tax=Patellaria atrata CBS 101060 TaxID=1346257 RepID=A0A9P4VQI9_9PEZI|nr:hypothetical protein M501DRAFT_1015977 [Patellaria atrata CBS 101060]